MAKPGISLEETDALAWRLDENLREAPLDGGAFARAVDARVDAIPKARSQPARLLAMLSAAAPLLRISGRLDEARKTASAAIALAELAGRQNAMRPSSSPMKREKSWRLGSLP